MAFVEQQDARWDPESFCLFTHTCVAHEDLVEHVQSRAFWRSEALIEWKRRQDGASTEGKKEPRIIYGSIFCFGDAAAADAFFFSIIQFSFWYYGCCCCCCWCSFQFNLSCCFTRCCVSLAFYPFSTGFVISLSFSCIHSVWMCISR